MAGFYGICHKIPNGLSMFQKRGAKLSSQVTYKINEIFESIQGEGAHTGIPSIFVRLQGCPVGCAWCDTKHTWEIKDELLVSTGTLMQKQQESEHWAAMTAEDILTLFKDHGYTAKKVILTGGEPCMYDLRPVSALLIANGYSVAIETSGTFEVLTHPDTWVTVSPKVEMKGGYEILTSALERADEIKHPVAMEKHIEELDALLARIKDKPQPLVYLQPISQQRRATELAVSTCIARNWRLSLQTHKFIGIE